MLEAMVDPLSRACSSSSEPCVDPSKMEQFQSCSTTYKGRVLICAIVYKWNGCLHYSQLLINRRKLARLPYTLVNTPYY